MLPLGDSWSGTCRALPAQPYQPDHAALDSCCNLGYARGTCARFPESEGPDAVRFTIAAADAASLRLYYVLERDHEPWAHGTLNYVYEADELAPPPGCHELMPRQARAYIESYLRRQPQS
jgi:hypothetical protein